MTLKISSIDVIPSKTLSHPSSLKVFIPCPIAVFFIKLDEALKIFEKIKTDFNLPILTDVHNENQCIQLKQDSIIDIIQIPAFLCRQTDLLLAAGRTSKIINVKKGQFLSPTDVKNIFTKIETTNNKNIMITERGTSFGLSLIHI